MTEEAVEMVTCQISGLEVEANKAIEYTVKDSDDDVLYYVSAEAILAMVENTPLKQVILEKVALSEPLFTEVVSIRKQAIAKQQGVQEGATEAVKAVQAAAEELGVDLGDVLTKAFPAPEGAQAEMTVDETPAQEVQENVH